MPVLQQRGNLEPGAQRGSCSPGSFGMLLTLPRGGLGCAVEHYIHHPHGLKHILQALPSGQVHLRADELVSPLLRGQPSDRVPLRSQSQSLQHCSHPEELHVLAKVWRRGAVVGEPHPVLGLPSKVSAEELSQVP